MEWVNGFPPLMGVVVLTLLPIFELRAAIPYGILATEQPWWLVAITAIGINWLVAPVVFLFLRYVLRFLLKWKWFAGVWERYTVRVQKRIEKSVNTWGAWGLAFFIGIPLPGSGVYTGALGAYLLGMGFRRFMWVALAGVVIAATLVTVITLTGSEAFSWLINKGAVGD